MCALAVGVTAALVALNSDSYDAARWTAPPVTTSSRLASQSHANGLAKPGRAVAGAAAYEQWYDQMFPGFGDCALVSGSRPFMAFAPAYPHGQLRRSRLYPALPDLSSFTSMLWDNSGCG